VTPASASTLRSPDVRGLVPELRRELGVERPEQASVPRDASGERARLWLVTLIVSHHLDRFIERCEVRAHAVRSA
jgi:hypothetical protein